MKSRWQLPNVHEVAREINAAHAQKREERRARRQASDFDIPIDSNPPGEDKPAARYRLSIRLMRRASRSRRMNICGV